MLHFAVYIHQADLRRVYENEVIPAFVVLTKPFYKLTAAFRNIENLEADQKIGVTFT